MGDLTMKKLQSHTSNKYRTSPLDKVRVCFYGRVSTQHEAQMNALENQIQWYESILSDHPNWEKINVYVDKGVTGTQAKKRQGFMQMIEDASKGEFDLICTREVSRFARNTLDSLNYTRQLGRMGVEVYFYNDNIWSCESDGELRLTLMSAMSQEESRHISERVLAGQSISRKKGVLYGNGNILGYRLVKGSKSSENTYEIIEDDAETVRMVYDFYLEGMGVKTIAAKMQELHRQTAKSGCKWDATKVLRILDNKTYAGYIGYHKSHTASFLDHARVPVRDRSQYEYVKGDFPAIIPEEKWNRVQSLKQKKVTCAGQGKYGKKRSKDRWVRVLVCECGRTYHKYKWRVNKSGEECCGYQCWNQVNNRKKSYRIKNGLDAEGYCDVPSICEWKLDFMLKHILQKIWKNPKETITVLTETIRENYVEGQETNTELGCLKRELERLKFRKERLLDMRLDNQIEESAFEEKRRQIQER
ncbi:MAG: recombinase family protein, partial [Lachnospiraceae bacterium]|nr:recombinase family protein [Lachnospiraceae bacterium]